MVCDCTLALKDDLQKDPGIETVGTQKPEDFLFSSDLSLDPTPSGLENLAAEILPAELRYIGTS